MLLLKISGSSHLYTRLLNICKVWHSLDLPLHLCFFHSPCQEFLNQRSVSIYWSVNQTLRTKLNFIIFINSFSLLPLEVTILFLCISFLVVLNDTTSLYLKCLYTSITFSVMPAFFYWRFINFLLIGNYWILISRAIQSFPDSQLTPSFGLKRENV